MADDYDKLLRDVEAALGSPGKPSGPAPGGSAGSGGAVRPAGRAAPSPAADQGRGGADGGGTVDRLRAGVPRAVVAGAGCGAVAYVTFSVLPLLDGLSGGLAAFGAAFVVSMGGRLRRRR